MTQIIVLSDIHGNSLALDAVLHDIEAQCTPDAIWVLGDLVAFCPWPAETLARLRALSDVAFLRGNTDRYLVTGRRPATSVRSPEDWERMPASLALRDAMFRWTVERLSYADYEFLRDLPPRLEMDILGYGRICAVHATPSDDETNLFADTPDEEVDPYVVGLDARLLLYGHTHYPVDRTVGSLRLVNDGSVGLPFDGEPRPAYVVLDFDAGRCTVTLRRVDYDVEAVVSELERVEHPRGKWIAQMLRRAGPVR